MSTLSSNRLSIVPATRNDLSLILELIKELAEYERLAHEVIATEEVLSETLFGERPYAEVVLAYYDDEPVGYALYFHSFSTFLGRPGLDLEDLFVRPAARGKGIGKALLAFVANVASERTCGRLEWSVLNWNEPAIGFYKSLGAKPMDAWTVYRMTGEPLARLASQSDVRS
ncbi:MAG: GNAT family N-acetyltransferase [Ignavibacteria bacterium]|nr:GNAT family N-acetyltransferase [Ignavibacteria bacterium]